MRDGRPRSSWPWASCVAAGACSSTGGKKAEESAAGITAGKADTPAITIAMITHAAPGDTFWDIIRKGAESASAKDNVTLKYSTDPDSGKQATLIQTAIDSKVDGIAVTLPDPPALLPTDQEGDRRGHPGGGVQRGHRRLRRSSARCRTSARTRSLAGQAGGKRCHGTRRQARAVRRSRTRARSRWRRAAPA